MLHVLYILAMMKFLSVLNQLPQNWKNKYKKKTFYTLLNQIWSGLWGNILPVRVIPQHTERKTFKNVDFDPEFLTRSLPPPHPALYRRNSSSRGRSRRRGTCRDRSRSKGRGTVVLPLSLQYSTIPLSLQRGVKFKIKFRIKIPDFWKFSLSILNTLIFLQYFTYMDLQIFWGNSNEFLERTNG